MEDHSMDAGSISSDDSQGYQHRFLGLTFDDLSSDSESPSHEDSNPSVDQGCISSDDAEGYHHRLLNLPLPPSSPSSSEEMSIASKALSDSGSSFKMDDQSPLGTKFTDTNRDDLDLSPDPVQHTSGNQLSLLDKQEISNIILSAPHFWQHAFQERKSLRPAAPISKEIFDIYLMKTWYDLEIHKSTGAIYVDTHTVETWDHDIHDDETFISLYRQRYFLPTDEKCEEKPVVFLIDHYSRFLACFMDYSSQTLHVLAGQDSEPWEGWNGPQYYRHICNLHGWECADVSVVKVVPVRSDLDDHAHISGVSLALVEHVLEKGLVLNQQGGLHITSSLKCHHLLRKKVFEYVLRILLNSHRCYGLLHNNPPSEWSAWMEQSIYPPISDELAQRYMDTRRDEDVESMKQLRSQISKCDDCQTALSSSRIVRHVQGSLFRGGRDRSDGRDASNDQASKAPEDALQDAYQERESDPDYLAKRKMKTKQRRARRNQNLPSLGRFDRPMSPPSLPAPQGSLLFPRHDPTFDDYNDGPTRDALLPYPGEYNLSEFSMVDRHRTFIDYGYRLLARFAHVFHMAPPVKLSDHIFPVGTRPGYTPPSCIGQKPQSLSRTFTEDDRKVIVHDSIEMGASEMLRAAGPDMGSEQSQDVFLRGRTNDGKLIRVNLQRDHVPLTEADVKISAEVDSFIFVGQGIRVLKSVKVYVTACVSRDPPIPRNNHVSVELLLPLSTEERMEYGPNRPSFLEKAFGLSQIPHMRFADLGEGLNVYVFFPRATHNKLNSFFKDATISYLDQWFFLQHVVLPALQQHVPPTDMARYGYDADGFNMKTATQTHMNGNKGTPKGLAVKPGAFHRMQDTMRDIVRQDSNGSLAPYGSFFFVLEAKGIGLGLAVEDMSTAAPAEPLENLFNHFSKIDFDFILDRANGESYFDVAFCINPVSSITGLGRLDCLEASFGAAGFLKGKQFPWNTMGYFGSMQAEMEIQRCRQTHILHRSWYLSFYNLSRNFENRPWAPSDEDAYHYTQRYREVWKSRISEYDKGAKRLNGYGIRDEYRIGGQALREFLGVALQKAYRMGACLAALRRLHKLESRSKATLVSLLSYMMSAVDTNPIVKDAHLRDALRDLNWKGVMGQFGMFFLQDLNLNAGPGEDLLPEIEDDTQSLLTSMKATFTRSRPRQCLSGPTITDDEDDFQVNDYPLGKRPTWEAIKRCLLTRPLTLLKAWNPLRRRLSNHTQVGSIFVMFTNQFWAYIHDIQLAKKYEGTSTLEDAMAIWTISSVQSLILEVDFVPCNAELTGSRPGKPDLPFRDRRRIFFPPDGLDHHPQSKWLGFLRPNGYITQYHRMLKDIGGSEDDAQAVDNDLKAIFEHLQCLPMSKSSTKSSPGTLWTQAEGRANLIVNPIYFKIQGVGNGQDTRARNKIFVVTRKQFEMKIGHSGPMANEKRRRPVGSKTLGRRKPPARKGAHHGSRENIDSGKDSDEEIGLAKPTGKKRGRPVGSKTLGRRKPPARKGARRGPREKIDSGKDSDEKSLSADISDSDEHHGWRGQDADGRDKQDHVGSKKKRNNFQNNGNNDGDLSGRAQQKNNPIKGLARVRTENDVARMERLIVSGKQIVFCMWLNPCLKEHPINMKEEDAISRGDTAQWLSDNYQLRMEEVERLTDLLNQLSLTLNGNFICIPDVKVPGFAKLIRSAIPDWSQPPGDLSTLFEEDCGLQYYINLSKSSTNLKGILYITLIHQHYILIEHLYDGNLIVGHNSLRPIDDQDEDLYASYNIVDQRILTAFLGKKWSQNMPNSGQRYLTNRLGRQKYKNERYDNTCGFWTVGMALFRIIGIPFESLPRDVKCLQNTCSVLWNEYQSSPAGGVSCELLFQIIQKFTKDWRELSTNLRGKKVCATRREDISINPSIFHDRLPFDVDLPRQMTYVLDRYLSQEIEKQLKTQPMISILGVKGGKVSLPAQKLLCLRPKRWLNDEVINGYAQLVQEVAKDGIIVLNSFFMQSLARGGYKGIERLWKKKVDDRPASKVIFPISQPIGHDESSPGNHWTLGIIDFGNAKIEYVNSHESSSEFLRFQQSESWTFRNQKTPQQVNGYDCGVFTCCSMLKEALRLEYTFEQAHMKNVRSHILLQLLRRTIVVPEYNLQPY